MDKISVIVPVYNGEKHISKTIDSILNQTYKNFELLIIDDGSTDNTKIIIEEYMNKDIRIKYYFQENLGPSIARNRGLDLSSGELICFVDSDDFISLHMLEILSKLLKKENADVVLSDIEISNKYDIEFSKDDGNTIILSNEQILKLLFDSQSNSGYTFTHSKLYKKKFLVKNNIKFQNINYSEDTLFNLDVYLNANKIVYCQRKLYCYYINNNSLTQRYDPNRDKKLDFVIEYILKQMNKNNYDTEIKDALNKYILKAIYNYIYNELNSNDSLIKIIRRISTSLTISKYYRNIVESKPSNSKEKLIKSSIQFNFLNIILSFYYLIKNIKEKYKCILR